MPALLLALAMQCANGAPPPCARPAAPGPNSVGVMLFNNLTRDTAYAYLSDGLATEIATSLARVPRLEVRSPGAVRTAQRGIEPDPRAVGRRLNVRYVVEGDFQRGGERIRVAVRLVAVPSGTQRWSEAYTRPASDLLAVQEEIARSVATAIAGQLLPQERSVLAARPTRVPEAYDRLLRGNFYLARRSPDGVGRAIDEYAAALRLDPGFAAASARIGLGYALFLDWGWRHPRLTADSVLLAGLAAADHALALDSSSAEAWMARGYLLAFRDPRTLHGVLEALERSVRLDDRNAEAWHQYGSWLTTAGRLDDALRAAQRAIALEPGRAVTHLQVGQLYEAMRRDSLALASYDSAVAAHQEFYAAYAFRTWVRLRAGDTAGARADAEAALRYAPREEEFYALAPAAAVAARAGDTVLAVRLMALATTPFAGRAPGPFASQMLAAGLVSAGRPEEAILWLWRTEPIGPVLWSALLFPVFDPLQHHPPFQRLVEQSRLPGAPR